MEPIDIYDSATPEPEFDGYMIDEVIAFIDEREREGQYQKDFEDWLMRNRFNYPDPVI